MLKIKDGIDLRTLENYGFEVGRNFIDRGERCICNESEHKDYWKFSMCEDEPENVLYADDDFDQAMVSIQVQSSANNRLLIECVPSGTYHISMDELDVITDTLYDMILDGVVEKITD